MSARPEDSQKDTPDQAGGGGGLHALDWVREHGRGGQLTTRLDLHLRRRRRGRQRIAAGAVVVAVLALTWMTWKPWQPKERSPGSDVIVLRPETRVLDDGSRVELMPGADIAVTFSATQRHVVLNRGAAHFAVATDGARPFVVMAGTVEARAVGTAFAVTRAAEKVEVLVTEGTVAVDHAEPQRATTQTLTSLTAGSGVEVMLDPRAEVRWIPIAGEDLRQRLHWRVPRLEFSGTPLSRVVALFNEHAGPNGLRLRLAEASIGTLEISGTLRADDAESLLRLLEGDFKLRATREPGEWVLSQR